jgi:integrase
MNGTVFKRQLAGGRITWGYSLGIGKDATGKRIRLFESGFKRMKEAEDALRAKVNEREAAPIVKPDPSAFSQWVERWFAEYAPRRCSPKTLERYRELAAYALPHLGHVPLADLSALMIEPVLFRLKESGGRDRKAKKARPLSAKTVRHIAGVLSVILKAAVKKKLRATNPMEGVELPRLEKRESKALDGGQLSAYLDAARSQGLYELLLFASATGARRGEVLALAWPDVDFDGASVRIARSLEQTRAGLRVKPTKTEKPRAITLPASIVELLRFHRETQQENRRLFGEEYRTDLDLVFCTPEGNYLRPDSITAKACLIARKAGFSNVGIHSLRHSHGSQLLSKGVPLPTVSKRLGHSDVYTTAKIYAHALPKDDVAAAELWDSSVGRALEAKREREIPGATLMVADGCTGDEKPN